MKQNQIYGYRARIGYTVAAVTTEIYPIDWYRVVPKGVSLMMITLPLGNRSNSDLKKCHEISIKGAQTMAQAGADLVLLGGLPINISKGNHSLEQLMDHLETETGVQMSCSALAQSKAFTKLGASKVCTIHPFLKDQNKRHERTICDYFGLESTGVFAGGSNLIQLGTLPPEKALQWGREAISKHPEADTLYFGCPHWTVVDAIEPLEKEFGVNVMTSLQAIAWESMRKTGINDPVNGFGRLLRDF